MHVDVMDGIFVPSISYGMPVMKCLRNHTDLFMDVHLMIDHPERYLKEFADSGADMIDFHIEATDKVEETIRAIHELGKKAAIAIKPGTQAEAVEPYLDMVDMVLVMTVEPGFGGQKLIPECLDKVAKVRRMAARKGFNLDIQVDGGIYLHNVDRALEAGANVIVAGSGIFKGDIGANTAAFLEALSQKEGK